MTTSPAFLLSLCPSVHVTHAFPTLRSYQPTDHTAASHHVSQGPISLETMPEALRLREQERRPPKVLCASVDARLGPPTPGPTVGMESRGLAAMRRGMTVFKPSAPSNLLLTEKHHKEVSGRN